MFTEFDSEPTYGDDDKYIKTKMKTYKDSIPTNFYKKKHMQMSINNNSRFRSLCIQKYYPQIFLEECKFKQQQQKQQEQQQHQQQKNYINEELKSDSDNDN